ncbi:MAG TPA: hypothetical protein VHX15_20915 [Frankiaceae bacterium]|nr:hypothetical protein [Frankiaceae bacterium]
MGPVAIALHNGPLTEEQQRWATVLSAGGGAGLAGRTALELAGLRGWGTPAIQLLTPVGGHPPRLPDIAVELHQTRRNEAYRFHLLGQPPRTTVERSALDAASWSTNPRACAGVLAAVVQQRLSTAPRLLEEMEKSGPIRHRPLMTHTLEDIAGGAQALSEIDIGKLCRRHGLMVTARQAVRYDAQGRRRYLDGFVIGRNGKQVAFEVDGAVHLFVRSYWEDMERANELLIAGIPLLRFPSLAVRIDGEKVVDQFRRYLA